MDENILTNESRDDEISGDNIIQTPSGKAAGINHMSGMVKGNHAINQINKASFTNQPGIKRNKPAKSGSVNTSKLINTASI